jgi:hypothetical protein
MPRVFTFYETEDGRKLPPKDRFWSHVSILEDVEQCWDWIKSTDRGGYGKIKNKQGTFRCSRLAYEYTYGLIPEGMMVCHTCDRPICCNPLHLFLGDAADNVYDMMAKGRHRYVNNSNPPKGEDNPQSMLTEMDVRKIRVWYEEERYTQEQLAKLFGIHQTTVSKIIRRTKWKHVE